MIPGLASKLLRTEQSVHFIKLYIGYINPPRFLLLCRRKVYPDCTATFCNSSGRSCIQQGKSVKTGCKDAARKRYGDFRGDGPEGRSDRNSSHFKKADLIMAVGSGEIRGRCWKSRRGLRTCFFCAKRRHQRRIPGAFCH